jgi:acetyl-CoA C-acetyltransferase
MSRVGIGASGGAWPVDPAIAIPSYFMPQGISADLIATKYGFSREAVDAYAVESQKRAAQAWGAGHFTNSVVAVRDVNGLKILDRDEHMRPLTDMQSLGALKPSFVMMAEQGGFSAVAIQAHPEVEKLNHVHHAGNSSGIVDGAAAVLIGNEEAGKAAGLKPRARIRAFANIAGAIKLGRDIASSVANGNRNQILRIADKLIVATKLDAATVQEFMPDQR